jgi:hypothetical protein
VFAPLFIRLADWIRAGVLESEALGRLQRAAAPVLVERPTQRSPFHRAATVIRAPARSAHHFVVQRRLDRESHPIRRATTI